MEKFKLSKNLRCDVVEVSSVYCIYLGIAQNCTSVNSGGKKIGYLHFYKYTVLDPPSIMQYQELLCFQTSSVV